MGTLINTAAIIIGGVFGHLFGRLLKDKYLEAMKMASGISVLFIGISGAIRQMLVIENNSLNTKNEMFVVICLVIGALVGEILDIEKQFENFGEFLKRKSGNTKDSSFVSAFLMATFTVCIGAMAIVGSIQDGLTGNWTILGTKAILDFIIIMVMTCSLGKGAVFSAVPVFIFQGAMTLLAKAIRPIFTAAALNNISLLGSILIFCVGVNLVFDRKIKVANLLPALVAAVVGAFLPI